MVEGWKWPRPNAHVYTLLIQGLAASLRVSDALRVLKYICEVGVSPGEEVCVKDLSFFLFLWVIYGSALNHYSRNRFSHVKM